MSSSSILAPLFGPEFPLQIYMELTEKKLVHRTVLYMRSSTTNFVKLARLFVASLDRGLHSTTENMSEN